MTESPEAIKQKLLNSKDLPTIPAVHTQVLKMIEDINYDVESVGNLIEKDQVLSSKLLKLVNSPFYGLYGNVASIKRAIILLGANLIRGLALSTALFDSADKSLPGLWDHSYCCSTVAGYLAKKLNVKAQEEIMTGALLHDLGKVLIRRQLPKEAADIDAAVKTKSITMREAEQMVIDISHDEAGAWLAEKWNLPKIIKDIIAYHHKPGFCADHSKEAAIVHLSDIIIKGIGVTNSPDIYVPALDQKGWNRLEISEEDLLDIVAEIIDKIQADKMFSKYL